MNQCVFIPCAGVGSRLGSLTTSVNKALVSVDNRPIISHIIDKCPSNSEFVIALGYKGEFLRDYLELVYPKTKFNFVQIKTFEGPSSSLGLTVLSCREFLQRPFVFVSCDTIIDEKIPVLESNWIGYSDSSASEQYRKIRIEHGKVTSILEKTEEVGLDAFNYIGLAGVFNFEAFWKAMDSSAGDELIKGEIQGIDGLVFDNLIPIRFSWHDAGNTIELEKAREYFQSEFQPNILEKSSEAIWFVDDLVIKFSTDTNFIQNRVKRSELLDGYVPKIISSNKNMYCYKKAKGSVLSEVISVPLFDLLLNRSIEFWDSENFTQFNNSDFENRCRKFYLDKSLERVELFYKTFKRSDHYEVINDKESELLSELLEQVDWNFISHGTPGRVHGDFHFENILFDKDVSKFTFLDWRQDFGGSLEVGDIYYDLAKLLHGLIVSHEIVTSNHFRITWTNNEINYDFYRKNILVECEEYFYKWLERNGFDVKKVRIITALIFLNIAPLHHNPYSLLLFALGKSMLSEEMRS